MLRFPGSDNRAFRIVPNTEASVTGGNSDIGGWFTSANNGDYEGVTQDKDVLIYSRFDSVVPNDLTQIKDGLQVVIVGVGDGNTDIQYAISAIEETGDGFRRMILEKTGYQSSITLTIEDVPPVFTPQIGVEVGDYRVITSNFFAVPQIWQTENCTARISGDDNVGYRVHLTATAQGEGYVIVRAEHRKDYADVTINFTAEGGN